MIHSAGVSVSRKKEEEEMVKGEEWREREAGSLGKEAAEQAGRNGS